MAPLSTYTTPRSNAVNASSIVATWPARAKAGPVRGSTGVGDLDDGGGSLSGPLRHGVPGVDAEGHDRFHGGGLGQVVQLVAPGQLAGVAHDVHGVRPVAGEQPIDEHVEAQVRTAQAELRKEALDALAGVTDQAPAGDALSGPGVRADAQDASGTIQPSPIEDGPPIEPEVVPKR